MANDMTLNHQPIQVEEELLDRARKRKSTRIAIGVHLLLLLLAFFLKCPNDKAIDHQYVVAINFEEIVEPEPEKLEDFTESSNSTKSQSTEGAAKETADKPAEIEEVELKPLETTEPEIKEPKPTPTPTPPTPTEIVSATLDDMETDVVAVEDEIEVEDAELEDVPEPAPDPEPVPDPEPAPKKNTSILDKMGSVLDKIKPKAGGSKDEGNKKGEPSRSDGKPGGTGKGETGTGKGSDKSGNDGDSGIGSGGLGEGKYDGSGRGVFGRKVIHRNFKEILAVGFGNQEGKRIVAKICINKGGSVVYAELLEMETNANMTKSQKKQVLKGFYGYRYEPDPTAPKEQCGKLSFVLENINTFGR